MVFLVLRGIAMYANPFLLMVAWFRRLKAHEGGGFRICLGWASLGLASVGFLTFVGGMFLRPPPATPMFDLWFAHWFTACISISGITFLTGLVGKGRMQWVVLISAIVTPLSCMLQKILE